MLWGDSDNLWRGPYGRIEACLPTCEWAQKWIFWDPPTALVSLGAHPPVPDKLCAICSPGGSLTATSWRTLSQNWVPNLQKLWDNKCLLFYIWDICYAAIAIMRQLSSWTLLSSVRSPLTQWLMSITFSQHVTCQAEGQASMQDKSKIEFVAMLHTLRQWS